MKINNKTGKVTRFMDMHSGGKLKTPFTHIYVDAPLDKALEIFKDTFKRDPDNITCKCCGEDFVYEEYNSLEEATAYDCKAEWNDTKQRFDYDTAKISIEKYFSGNNKVLFITE
jgi:hypothetical protein